MYANFYNDFKVLFSVEVNSEKQAESLFEKENNNNPYINDYTVTDKPLSKKILK